MIGRRARRGKQHIFVILHGRLKARRDVSVNLVLVFLPRLVAARTVAGERQHAHHHAADALGDGQP